MAARNWTPEQRQQQAERIKTWKPWAQSTGPRTADGKAVASQNGWKGGHREMLRELARVLAAHREHLDQEKTLHDKRASAPTRSASSW